MDEKVRVALVGCGSIAQRGILPHLAQEDARQMLHLAAVCDVVEARARETADRFGVSSWYPNLADALSHEKLDGVLLATPIPYHFEDAMLAVEAGLHVYLQKTMTTTLAEADQLIRAAGKRGVRLVASPGQMLSPAYQQLRQALQGGIIGQPYWAIASTAFIGHEHEGYRADHPVDPTWYYKPGGGPVYDMAVYTLHSLTGLLGPARRVTAMSGIGLETRSWQGGGTRVEMDDNTLFLLDFDGCFASVGGHFCQTGKVIGWGFMGIYGSHGTLEITGLTPGTGYPARVEFVNAHPVAGFPEGSNTVELNGLAPAICGEHARMEEAHVWADIQHWAECILEGRQPLASAEHARHVIEIIENGYIAARDGQTQEVRTTFSLP
jgi:predicted dehydrogenase